MIRTSMGRGVADARLRVWAPQGSEVLFVRQVAPAVEDLTAARRAGRPAGPRVPDRRVGRREPRLPRGRARAAGAARQRAARRAGRGGGQRRGRGQGAGEGDVERRRQPDDPHRPGGRPLHRPGASWPTRSRRGWPPRPPATIARRPCCSARRPRSPTRAATRDTTRLLAKVVDVVDAEAGTVRLKSNVDKADEMALDTRSTKTTRIRDGAVTTVTCPNGHRVNDPEWCDTCGAPIGGSRRPAPAPRSRRTARAGASRICSQPRPPHVDHRAV